eukprot:CAMPEP_0201114240 /NCGR_PEP_ID=MMETSP0812-20130820/78288_1 /ASSEMBLY_ACC=CAM_ASM_000668 /TAXON_ID=98059 /ORGANISM="Dinobryon sp., Strain UTEXLB2267" /LENGTH=363 /DNA_ID=CAMNT_0047377855 /DNA_START=211 /DNA_END=1303 /DNA_ORIENTATION=-
MSRLLASGVEFSAPPNNSGIFSLLGSVCYALLLWKISSRMMKGPQDDGVGTKVNASMEESSSMMKLPQDDGVGTKVNLKPYGTLSFDDVAGQEEAKQEVQEVCEMLRQPARYSRVGARLPAGVLLVGPPGSGKTLLARVTAAEAKVPFFACSASDFVEVFVGRGPARVRTLFKQAAKAAPSIVFIDEIDSIGRARSMGSMNSEQETTLNQILTCMDGLDTSNNGVVVMAATNRLELLDPALLRAGRFDRIVQCPLPDRNGRLAILKVHTKKLKVSEDLNLERVSLMTPGTSGAELCAIVNEAAIRTARRGGEEVTSEDMDGALQSFFKGRGGIATDGSIAGFLEKLSFLWSQSWRAGKEAAMV